MAFELTRAKGSHASYCNQNLYVCFNILHFQHLHHKTMSFYLVGHFIYWNTSYHKTLSFCSVRHCNLLYWNPSYHKALSFCSVRHCIYWNHSYHKGLVNTYLGFGTGAFYIFQCEKSICPILKENKQKILSYQCWGLKQLKFYDNFSRKSIFMCPVAFCTGPNPPMNIDLSLKHCHFIWLDIAYIGTLHSIKHCHFVRDIAYIGTLHTIKHCHFILLDIAYTVEPHLSGHLRSQADCTDNWISG